MRSWVIFLIPTQTDACTNLIKKRFKFKQKNILYDFPKLTHLFFFKDRIHFYKINNIVYMDLFHIFVATMWDTKYIFHKVIQFAAQNKIIFLDLIFNFNKNVLSCVFFKIFFISSTRKENIFFKNYTNASVIHKNISIFKNIMLVFRLIRLEYTCYTQFKHLKHKKYLTQKAYSIFIFSFIFKKTFVYNFFTLQKKMLLRKIAKKKL